MGINTSNGCRKIKRENDKSLEICFCSDQDLCNQVTKLTKNYFIIIVISCSVILFVKKQI